jgi:hypothetical protein
LLCECSVNPTILLGLAQEFKVACEIAVNSGQTPLFWAVKAGDKSIVQLPLENGVDPEAEDKNGQTPLS